MCGRYVITSPPEAIRRLFDVHDVGLNVPPHFNAAPGQDLPVIRLHPETGQRVLGLHRWGLIPYWSKDPKIAWKCINARGETVKTTSAFRSAYLSRRCLVPADVFYEWKATGVTKQPYAIALRYRDPFAFAGLWENWHDPKADEWVRTFAILTTRPNELVAPLHGRMPVILAPESYDRWLGDEADPADLMRPYPADQMVTWPDRPRSREFLSRASRRTLGLNAGLAYNFFLHPDGRGGRVESRFQRYCRIALTAVGDARTISARQVANYKRIYSKGKLRR